MEIIPTAIATGLPADLAAAVASTSTNLWALAVIAISLPLTFYVIKRVMGLFPKTK